MRKLIDDVTIIDKSGDMHRGKLSLLSRNGVKGLLVELLGDMEVRETQDMSLNSWSNEDYKAFGRNELRDKILKKVNEL